MIEYLWALMYIILGLLGGAFHWIKKRYIDDTTLDNFYQYLHKNFTYTKRATFAIICAEIALSVTHEGNSLGLNEVITTVSLGYTTDSTFNRSTNSSTSPPTSPITY